ncbi:di/tricarboxylate transporter [Methanofollis sp. W23]|uniref:SLC13 family permease n=1 Tax=Methanofollis sp. W23 TaxID=2817849 RepID=UPI001AE3FC72|nr:SLC13 family permease [Methanofollis sp. W23]MBP2145041.1 di/tricarboxylate transporter [Methanofollis sp. W23]
MDIGTIAAIGVLLAAVVLFVTERFRLDVTAALLLLALAWLGLVTPAQAFSGFASNAVVAMASVMVLGYGIDRAGLMHRVSQFLIARGGRSERRLVVTASAVVGMVSSVMQNIGAAVLFLPALLRVARSARIPPSRLLMPAGFAVILGGTVTMVGSTPLILLNDIMLQGGYEPFGLFAPAPVGLALLLTWTVLLALAGRHLLPRPAAGKVPRPQEDLVEGWDLPAEVCYCRIPETSPLVGMTREEAGFIAGYTLHLLALSEEGDVLYAPWRYTHFLAGQELALLGKGEDFLRCVHDYGLEVSRGEGQIVLGLSQASAGFAEVVVRPNAGAVGRTLRELTLRKNLGVEPLLLVSSDEGPFHEFSDRPLKSGDIIVVHGRWERLRTLAEGTGFVLATPLEEAGLRESRAPAAAACFAGALLLTLTGAPIGLSFFTGAVGMVLSGVVSVGEAYQAIEWQTIVLIGGLIPLGIAMETSGATGVIAAGLTALLAEHSLFLVLLGFSLLTAFLSLFLSNAAATVLLVPPALALAGESGLDPTGLALLIGVSASNSFLLPTNQVNALLMGPGGYRTRDYLRVGAVLTPLVALVSTSLVYLLYF